MKELVVIILALDIIAELFLIRRLRKERDDAEKRVTTHFEKANKFEKDIEMLLDNASELRSENEELGIFKYNVIKILESNDFTYDQIDKIKELISDYQSEN